MSDKNPTKRKPNIGITIGDINGIGPEVIIKALADQRMTKFFTPIIYATGGIISYYRRLLDLNDFNFHQTRDFSNLNPKKVNVLNIWDEKVEVLPGDQNPSGGLYAKKSLDQATVDLKNKKIDAIVTAPISKELVKSDDFDFPGHTEYFTQVFDREDSLMFMISDDLRIGVATGHIPLKNVSEALNSDLLTSKMTFMIKSLQKDFGIKKPKVAILGLNPHAGENGMLGKEEIDLLGPSIENMKNHGNLVFGPFSADGFFGSSQFKGFDGILAMYHDQGLIPFKHISRGEGVNYTAGLPVIRTSPAHGTAFELAGKNLANPDSMRNALFMAYDLWKRKSDTT